MRPKLQKQSALKLAGRIIPHAQRAGINDTLFRNNGINNHYIPLK